MSVMDWLAVAEQVLASVTVTVYGPPELSVMLALVIPLLHKYVAPPSAVSCTLGCEQVSDTLPEGVMTATGSAFTVAVTTVREADKQPLVVLRASA